jgi:hypothetical protein
MGRNSVRAVVRVAWWMGAGVAAATAVGCGAAARPAPTPAAAGPSTAIPPPVSVRATTPPPANTAVAFASAGSAAPAPVDRGPAGRVVTQDQVVVWASQGTRDDIIIDRIERSRAVFRLSPADERRLHQQGVSTDVIVAMRESCWR